MAMKTRLIFHFSAMSSISLGEVTMFLSAWLLYVAGGWWCALFFNKSWLIAFGFFCVAYPCLFVMPFLAISSLDAGSQFYIGLNLLLLAFISWHSWRLFRYKRMKKQ